MDRVKRVAHRIMEMYPEAFGGDFGKNKEALEKVAEISSKQLRNQIAGVITRTMRESSPSEEMEEVAESTKLGEVTK